MGTWSNLNFQNSASPLMEQLIFFHDHAMIVVILITIFILFIMVNLIINKNINRFYLSNQMMEMIWTIFPALFLIFIGFPSLRLLYLIDEIKNPLITIKTIGHQWYWSYEYSDFKNINFDSYMINEYSPDNFRLLDVDNRITLPINTQIRMLITASDVIHSWTVPCLGTKMDAIPGRTNQNLIMINRPGVFYGQCSEICGMNHSFMPIVLEGIKMNYFLQWLKMFN